MGKNQQGKRILDLTTKRRQAENHGVWHWKYWHQKTNKIVRNSKTMTLELWQPDCRINLSKQDKITNKHNESLDKELTMSKILVEIELTTTSSNKWALSNLMLMHCLALNTMDNLKMNLILNILMIDKQIEILMITLSLSYACTLLELDITSISLSLLTTYLLS